MSDDDTIVQKKDWNDKFQHTKFNPPQDINQSDSLKAFDIAISILNHLEKPIQSHKVTILSYDGIGRDVYIDEFDDLESWLVKYHLLKEGSSIW